MHSTTDRQAWMATLAKAPLTLLEEGMNTLDPLPHYNLVRPPEIGLVMVRGRAGGTGQKFNLGEMTVTRCVVQLDDGVGFGYVAGRSHRHAELAAVCDALLQLPAWHEQVQRQVIAPLDRERDRLLGLEQRQTAATKVDFFNLVRGDD